MHAAIGFALHHTTVTFEWHRDSQFVVVVAVPDEAALLALSQTALALGVEPYVWHEPDQNGEVWGGELHGREFLRYNPRTGHWTEYAMPEPYSHSRAVWVDKSTTPTTVWYADYSTGRIVRIQPME